MRILLLGKNGMLGHALYEVLKDTKLTALNRADLDITNFEETKRKIEALNPEIVINAVGYTNVDGAETANQQANLINGIAVGHLAESCHSIDATLVHFGTDYIFNDRKKAENNETDNAITPINAYGKSKALGEELIQNHLKKFIIIRTSWVFGPHGHHFVDAILRLAAKQTEIKVVKDQFGKPTFSFDLAQATKSLIENYVAGKLEPGIYHLTNEGAINWYKFAQEIIRLKKLPVKIIPVSTKEFPRPARRPHYGMLKNNKLPLLRPWREALQDYFLNYPA